MHLDNRLIFHAARTPLLCLIKQKCNGLFIFVRLILKIDINSYFCHFATRYFSIKGRDFLVRYNNNKNKRK